MPKSIHQLHADHSRHRLATYFIFLFIVFLGIAVILIAQGQKELGSTSLQTHASEDTRPTPVPASCVNSLTSISYKGQKQCAGDQATSVIFGCLNGYLSEVLGNGCVKQAQLKMFAEQECLYQSSCTADVPKIDDVMIVKDSSCALNQSKTVLIKCSVQGKGDGSVSWARVNNNTCQTISAWRADVRSTDVCQSRKTPWFNPTPTPPYPTVTPYMPTATPAYATPTPANPTPTYPTATPTAHPFYPTATPTPHALP